MNDISSRKDSRRLRVQSGLFFVFAGLFLYILGVKPDWFGADRSPIVGFVQISVFLVGLAGICLGGYLTLNALWNGMEKTIAADFGFRLVSTGYVISVASGMADVIGFGNQPSPAIPYFGPWQATGVMLGEFIIIIGFILLIPPPYRGQQKTID
jgi:hypothetical protein